MRQIIADTSSWPAGVRLAVFFFVPAVVILQALRLVADFPLYLEYLLTTFLRSHWGVAAPPIVGDMAAAVSTAGRATRQATAIVVVLGATIAGISIAVANGTKNGFLVTVGDLISQWWDGFVRRAGAAA